MDDKIIAIFCLGDDLLQALHHHEDRQCQMHDADIMPTAFMAALCFRGQHESARTRLTQYGSSPPMVSKRRFRRRLHRLKALGIVLGNLWARTWNTRKTDTHPAPTRISH